MCMCLCVCVCVCPTPNIAKDILEARARRTPLEAPPVTRMAVYWDSVDAGSGRRRGVANRHGATHLCVCVCVCARVCVCV